MSKHVTAEEAEKLLKSLKTTELEVLSFVARRFNEPLVADNIAEELGLSYTTVVRTLSKLQKLNILEKKRSTTGGNGFCYDANFEFSEQMYLALVN